MSAKGEARALEMVRTMQRWGLHTPTIILLELLKPFGLLGEQVLFLVQPVLAPLAEATGLLESQDYEGLAEWLAQPEAVERLVKHLEDGDLASG